MRAKSVSRFFRLNVLIVVAAVVFAVISPLGFNLGGSQALASPQTYSYTGAAQLYVVPAGVTSINVELRGAQGGSTGSGVGGTGAVITATLAVTPGESIQINVGGSGDTGGWNGGARGGAGGGGATDIRRPAFSTVSSCAFDLGCALSDRVLVAGGGGGAASFNTGSTVYTVNGGSAALVGSAGTFVNWTNADNVRATGDFTRAGQGGTSSAGGLEGDSSQTGGDHSQAGALGLGGYGGYSGSGITGGGGGAGYYGGGGGGQSTSNGSSISPNGLAGGGGGSSFLTGVGASAGMVTGSNTGHGSVVVSVASAITNASAGYTGAPQFYTVASGVTELYVKAFGAGTGGSAGDVVWGRLPVTSNQVLQINVGGQGWGFTPSTGFTAYSGGWNGGGSTQAGGQYDAGTGGGGATDIRVCSNPQSTPCTLADRVVVSGGGGGGYVGQFGLSGGTGGAEPNGSGAAAGNVSGSHPNPAGGGTLLAGGLGTVNGSTFNAALNGALGVGGTGTLPGGGGGGGYYGGGASNGAGGGGGSSFASVTGSSGPSVLGTAGAAFQHNPYPYVTTGSVGDGRVIIAAVPQATSTSGVPTSYTAATITGSVNPRYLATTPKVYYGTSQSAVEARTSSSANLTGPNSSSTLAGTTVQTVSGGITGLSAGTTYYYSVCAQSVTGLSCGAVQQFATAVIGTPIWVDQDASTSRVAGTAFPSYTYQATGTAPMTYALQSGALPPGLQLVAGVLSGTPTTVGTYTFTVSAQNSVATINSVTNTIVITAAPVAPTITSGDASRSVSSGTPITPYTYAASGTGPITFSVSQGSLPPGVTLDPSTGQLSGTPSTAGTYTFRITATGAAGTATTVLNTITVVTPSVAPSSLPFTGFGSAGLFPWALAAVLAGVGSQFILRRRGLVQG